MNIALSYVCIFLIKYTYDGDVIFFKIQKRYNSGIKV